MSRQQKFSFLKGKSVTTLIALSALSLVAGLSLVTQSFNTYTYKTRAAEPTENVQCPEGTTLLFKKLGSLNNESVTVPGTSLEDTSGSWEIGGKSGLPLAMKGGTLSLFFPYYITFEKVIINDDTIDSTKSGPEVLNGEEIVKHSLDPNNLQPAYLYDLKNKGPYNYLEFATNSGDASFNVCVSSKVDY
ncbi:hypothetical protein BH09PAT2_BH09PAT2_06600 [soil metagenome]